MPSISQPQPGIQPGVTIQDITHQVVGAIEAAAITGTVVQAFPDTPSMEAPKRKTKKSEQAEEFLQEVIEPTRPVIYPKVDVEICQGDNAFTERAAKEVLGWVTEAQFQRHQMSLFPGSTAEMWQYKDVYMLVDEEGNKVRCVNNLDNRPFDESHSRGLAQTLLNFKWAGQVTLGELVEFVYGNENCFPVELDGTTYNPGDPILLPEGTVNGSTITVSRTGKTESGQHSLVGLVLANQILRKNPDKYPWWKDRVDSSGEKTGVVLETIFVTGVSEDPRVLMTVDNCKPRTVADVLYTSELFRIDPKTKQPMNPGKRKEMSRMFASALDLFWKHTDTKGYKTHSETMGLLERHPRLVKCLEHVFTENSSTKHDDQGKLVGGRSISNLNISAGQAVALCYFMGCCDSDGDAYRNGMPPSEKSLDWSHWVKAKKFWAMLGTSKAFEPVRIALLRLVETDPDSEDKPGLGGRVQERLAIIAKAWEVWKDDEREFTDLDLTEGGCLHLSYLPPMEVQERDSDGNFTGKTIYTPATLEEDAADFGGIWVAERTKKGGETPVKKLTKEEMAAAQERVRLEKAQETAEIIRTMRLNQGNLPVTPKPAQGPTTGGIKLGGK